MKIIGLMLLLVLLSTAADSQIRNSFSEKNLILSFSINQNDSNIVVKPILTMNKKSNIFIQTPNKFEEEGLFPDYDGRVYIKKEVLGFFINLSITKLKGIAYGQTFGKRRLILGANVLDSFYLNSIMPLEKGKYLLRIELDCMFGKIKKSISSEDVEFECVHDYGYPAN